MADRAAYAVAAANAEMISGERFERAKKPGRAIPEPHGRLEYA